MKTPINMVKKILIGFAALIVLGSLVLSLFIGVAVAGTPQWDPGIFSESKSASIVYDKNGNQIALLSAYDSRLYFEHDEMPPLLIQTIVAVEDKNFYKHTGFDFWRIVRGALSGNSSSNSEQSGVSTITMQLVNNVFAVERSNGGLSGFTRKIQEINLAMQIERTFTKEEILTAYMTQVFFGQGAYGARSAAMVYFGKDDLSQLTIPEVAMICGLPQAPSSNNPYLYPERAQERRAHVLNIMKNEELITPEEYETYVNWPFTYIQENASGSSIADPVLDSSTKYPYFVDYLVNSLLTTYDLTHEHIYRGGLHIYTTIDPIIQQTAEAAMRNPENFPAPASDGTIPQGAFVMLDNATGNIVSMVGGREYYAPQGFNRATDGWRQSGTAATPLIVYAPALESGRYNANTWVEDTPLTIGSWTPRNFSGSYLGNITLRQAVTSSANTVAVKVYQTNPEYNWSFAVNNLGLAIDPATHHFSHLSNALGSWETTTLELAHAYSSFPNNGKLNRLRSVTRITDSAGNILLETNPENNIAMKEETAQAMSDILNSVVTNGTGAKAQIGTWYICGITGANTQANTLPDGSYPIADAWFIGYSPLYTAAVWMGFDVTDMRNKQYLVDDYGGNKPAGLWQQVMEKALEDHPVQSRMP
jgi:penicillin-binding protein 1A